jgi:hypothetical protein
LECEGNAGQKDPVSSGHGFRLPAPARRQAGGARFGRHNIDHNDRNRFDCEEAGSEEDAGEIDYQQDDNGRSQGQSCCGDDSEDIAHHCGQHPAEAYRL